MKLLGKKYGDSIRPVLLLVLVPMLSLAMSSAIRAVAQSAPQPTPQKETHITPEQTKELFRSLNQILSFASDDSQLPIKHEVKRRMITREEVEKYVLEKFHEDKDAKRMQREEIVLKKFGMLDRDFQLQPFLVTLLKEQIAGFYDNKTKNGQPARLGFTRRTKAGHSP